MSCWIHHVILLLALFALGGSAAAAPQGGAPAAEPCASLAERILAEAGTTKGFCVDLGCGSGELALAILQRSELFVHALETDDARVAAARRTLEPSGLYGRRTAAARGDLARLPYPDYCANLVVRGDLFAEGDRGISWREVVRILRPGGLAYVGPSAAVGR